jgi:RNA polymerase sigma-32 factor
VSAETNRIAQPIIDTQAKILDSQVEQGNDYYQYAKAARPVEDALRAEALAAGSVADQEAAAGRAVADVRQGTTAAQKKLFFNLRKAKSEISAFEEGDMRPEQVSHIATQLGVLNEEVISMNRRLSGPDASLNAPLRVDGEGEWQDWLADDNAVSQETQLADSEEHGIRMSLLQSAMTELNDRERHILTERRLKDEPTTLEDLASHYGVSRERVRQIEVLAFEKLQKSMKAAAHEQNLMLN